MNIKKLDFKSSIVNDLELGHKEQDISINFKIRSHHSQIITSLNSREILKLNLQKTVSDNEAEIISSKIIKSIKDTLKAGLDFANLVLSLKAKTYTVQTIKQGLKVVSDFTAGLYNKLKKKKENIQALIAYKNSLNNPYHLIFSTGYKRTITCYLAPTNSGKTYKAREMLIELSKSSECPSAMLFPLRALASENYYETIKKEDNTSLYTGNEIKENTGITKISSSTVEAFSTNNFYESVLVDEAHLLFDKNRGAGYLRALTKAKTNNLILTAAPEYKSNISFFFGMMGEQVNFIELDRLSTLQPIKSPVTITDVKKGDLIVAFSLRNLLSASKKIKENTILKTGIIYGGMPPDTRKRITDDYINGDIDIILSTDAIGLGCNFPIKRTLFAETSKFDGEDNRQLSDDEIRQISGRAGRFGLYDHGQYGVIKGLLSDEPDLHLVLEANKNRKPIDIEMLDLYLQPDKEALYESHLGINQTIDVWTQGLEEYKYYNIGRQTQELKEKAKLLNKYLVNNKIDKKDIINLIFISFNHDKLINYYLDCVAHIANGEVIKTPISISDDIRDLEYTNEQIDIILQIQRYFPENTESYSSIIRKKKSISNQFYQIIKK